MCTAIEHHYDICVCSAKTRSTGRKLNLCREERATGTRCSFRRREERRKERLCPVCGGEEQAVCGAQREGEEEAIEGAERGGEEEAIYGAERSWETRKEKKE